MTPEQRGYKAFRRKYSRFLRQAKSRMGTTEQRAILDLIAATSFSAGYRAQKEQPTRMKLTPWRKGIR